MDSNHSLDVVVGCPLVLSQLPKAPCLVLDADPQSFERLRSTTAGEEHPWPLTFQQCVLAEDDGNDVVWNIFNDERFNGPNDINSLKKYGINLAQISSQVHQGRSLPRSLRWFVIAKPVQRFDFIFIKETRRVLRARLMAPSLLTNHTPCPAFFSN